MPSDATTSQARDWDSDDEEDEDYDPDRDPANDEERNRPKLPPRPKTQQRRETANGKLLIVEDDDDKIESGQADVESDDKKIETGEADVESDHVVGGTSKDGNVAKSSKGIQSDASAPARPAQDKVEKLWAEMQRSTKAKPRKRQDSTKNDLQAWMNSSALRSGPASTGGSSEIATLVDETPGKPSEKREDQPVAASATRTEPESSLDSLVATLKHNKSTFIDQSRQSWVEYKADNNLLDELDAYKKDRNRYTDRLAFLQRAEHREWESEQREKRRRRSATHDDDQEDVR